MLLAPSGFPKYSITLFFRQSLFHQFNLFHPLAGTGWPDRSWRWRERERENRFKPKLMSSRRSPLNKSIWIIQTVMDQYGSSCFSWAPGTTTTSRSSCGTLRCVATCCAGGKTYLCKETNLLLLVCHFVMLAQLWLRKDGINCQAWFKPSRFAMVIHVFCDRWSIDGALTFNVFKDAHHASSRVVDFCHRGRIECCTTGAAAVESTHRRGREVFGQVGNLWLL